MKRVYLSLGSNLGDRAAQLRTALARLPAAGIEVRQISSFYQTEPVDFLTQRPFVNCVAEVETDLMPLQLLTALQGVERAMGRRRGVSKGPRPIDIDILLYENAIVRSAALTIPHERMSERRFVLIPLRELAAQIRHPRTKRTVAEMLEETPDRIQVVRLRAE